MNLNLQKFYNVLAFFKTTLVINLCVSFFPLIIGGLEFFEPVFLTIGFFSSLVCKEIMCKNDYVFYLNNGLSKVKLWVLSYIMNFVFLILLVIIYKSIENLF